MTEEKQDIDIINDPGRILSVLGGAGGSPLNVTVLKKIRFVWPLFRRPTAEADAFEATSVPGGPLKTTNRNLWAGPAIGAAAWDSNNDQIGDTVIVAASMVAGIAGNVNAVITPAVPVATNVYECQEILLALINGAAVANRTPFIEAVCGLRIFAMPIPLVSIWDWSHAGQVAIANQEETIFVPPSPGAVVDNMNGAYTYTAQSPLPLITTIPRIQSRIQNGAAGDAHNIVAVFKRVA